MPRPRRGSAAATTIRFRAAGSGDVGESLAKHRGQLLVSRRLVGVLGVEIEDGQLAVRHGGRVAVRSRRSRLHILKLGVGPGKMTLRAFAG